MLLAAIADTKHRVTDLNGRLHEVVGKVRVQKDVVAALKAEQDDINSRHDRQRDIIIKSLPLTGRETMDDLRSIVIRVGSVIGLKLLDTDIVHVFRAGDRSNSGRESLVVVRFGSLGIRADFFRKYMAVPGGLNSTALGFKTHARIYVSDNLTPRNTAIRSRAVVCKRDGLISGHTVRDGIVYVTLSGEKRKRAVHSIVELDELVRNNKSTDSQRVQVGPSSASSALAGGMDQCFIGSEH